MASESQIRAGGAAVEVTASDSGLSGMEAQRKWLDQLSSFGQNASFKVQDALEPIKRQFERAGEDAGLGFLKRWNGLFGRFSLLGQVSKLLRGTGPVLALTLLARETAAATDAMVDARNAMIINGKSFGMIADEMIRKVPILGSVYRALYNIGELATGANLKLALAQYDLQFADQSSQRVRELTAGFGENAARMQYNQLFRTQAFGFTPGGREQVVQERDIRNVVNDKQLEVNAAKLDVQDTKGQIVPNWVVEQFRFLHSLGGAGLSQREADENLRSLENQLTLAKQQMTAARNNAMQPTSAAGTYNPFVAQGLGAGASTAYDIKRMADDIAAIRARSIAAQPNAFTND